MITYIIAAWLAGSFPLAFVVGAYLGRQGAQ